MNMEVPTEESSMSLKVISKKIRRSFVTTFPGVIHAWNSGTTASGAPARYSLGARLLAEFCGTFVLVLSATIETQAPGTRAAYLASQGQPFAVAATVVIIVTIGAPVSGAHYNPAISLAFWLSGERTHADQPLIYACTQILAGTAAAAVAYGLDGYDMGLPVLHPADPAVSAWAKVCVAEVLATFLFCSHVLYVAMVAHPPLGNFGPVAVGLGVFAIIMSFRFASGAVFNPAIGTSLWIIGMAIGTQERPFAAIVCFTLSDLLGAALAGTAILHVLRSRDGHTERFPRRTIGDDSLMPALVEPTRS